MDLDAPRAVHVATRLADVVAVLAEADRAAARGQWAAVMVAYEAAAAFDPAMASAVRDDGELALPLAWVAVFDDATVIRRPPHEPSHAAAPRAGGRGRPRPVDALADAGGLRRRRRARRRRSSRPATPIR